jgi:hypothetical protein
MGRVYRETTLAMLAPVTIAVDERLTLAQTVAANLLLKVGKGRSTAGSPPETNKAANRLTYGEVRSGCT